ncbi:LamG-like jellyroll fold domain-containing protein [Kribbella sp. DT2]|uniref:LamG-like jellyroll fold domain-containing protein n=1 Tax=Kribbella sp. DT2 TaxID=3393427 RepID=UPI003CF807B1
MGILALGGALVAALLSPVPAQGISASLSALPSAAWQTNASVQGLAVAAGKAYVGGRFTTVRPPGAAAGTNQTNRTYLAAFDQATGALDTGFNHTLNGMVWAVAASADGSRVFVGGDFTQVDGQTRNRIAAFDTATGALVSNWKPSVSYRVKALAVSGSTVYLGGSFGLVNNVARPRLAAVTTSTATLLPWAPQADNDTYAIDVADDGSKVYVGGTFATMNGVARWAVASLDPVTGALQPFPAASAVPDPAPGCTSRVKDIETAGDRVYFANAGDGGGCFDGTWAADVASGNLLWKNNCLGATEAITYVSGWLYKGSHAHDCSYQGGSGFPQGAGRFLLTQNVDTGELGPWFPNTNTGTPTAVGPLVSATGGTDLWVGGDFTTVNGSGQQGLARFTSAGPGAAPAKPAKVVPVSYKAGQVKVNFQTVLDNDDIGLTYRVLRSFSNTTVATSTAESRFWNRPWLSFTDTGLTPGSSQVYRIEVTDGNSTLRGDYSLPVTVASVDAPYDQQVLADGPTAYWRLGEPNGTANATDSSSQNNTGPYDGVSLGATGVLTSGGNTAGDFGANSRLIGQTVASQPQNFSVEAWYKTTSGSGGKIVGFGNSPNGTSSQYDRHLYLQNNGVVTFGVYDGSTRVINSAAATNDGQWHHVVGTFAPGEMKFYLDGVLQGTQTVANAEPYTGYWRIGADNLNAWPNQPSNAGINGTVDEVAVYPTALTGDQVQTHFDAR